MKKIIYLFSSFLLIYSVQAQKKSNSIESYRIEIKIPNTRDTIAYLGYHYGNQKYAKDTAKVQKGGVFVFDGNSKLEAGMYFLYCPSNLYFDFIVNDTEQKFTMESDTSALITKMKVKGSFENQLFFDFQRYMEGKQKEFNELNRAYEISKSNPADSATILEKMRALDREVRQYRRKLAEKNPTTVLAKNIWLMERMTDEDIPPKQPNDPENYAYLYYKKHFFDNINFGDLTYLRSPFMHERVMEYIEKLTPAVPDSAIESATFIIEKARANKDMFRYFLVTLTNHYERSNIMGMENVFVHLAEKYYLSGMATWADSTLLANLRKRVEELKPNLIGKFAPQMVLYDTLLRRVSLRDVKAKYIILFFYDPGCGHCRKAAPELKKAYDELILKGYDIKVLAISTILDVEEWKKFVREYNFGAFINLSDPYYQDRPKEKYDVRTTPMIYLLDKNQKIIGRRLEPQNLVGFIEFEERRHSN
ncbi:MAG: DUF5106 domain-containing protein [Cytophagales bacterium]|nr:DUF5106 domain-containing protein [Cytophagales bacterium]MDW8384822.1 DUF5106 domain-containing protein [Flammeovirgaceae bacterium]